jgi:hypothetical protein
VKYQPSTKIPAEHFIIGDVMNESTRASGIQSPSIHGLDKSVSIKPAQGFGSAAGMELFRIEYDSQSFIHFEIGKTYLFAIGDDTCIGFREVIDNRILLPDLTSQSVEDFIRTHLHQTFPDYLGLDVGITP